jgi:hypothetical protein
MSVPRAPMISNERFLINNFYCLTPRRGFLLQVSVGHGQRARPLEARHKVSCQELLLSDFPYFLSRVCIFWGW